MLYLARIQMRLVLDLAVVYDLQLDADDPEDILMIFGYALGIAPTELIGQGIQIATKAGTPRVVKKYVAKGTLKSVQNVSQKLIGKRILQRTIIKFVTPLASVVVGSSYNYVTTKSVGAIAKAHLKNRGQVTDELRQLVSRQNTYVIAFPAAAMYMAQVDGEFSAKEKDFYRALLSRMSFEEHTQAEFQKLVASEENILDAIAELEDDEVKNSLIEVMVLMAVYDGKLAEEERKFLINTADYLNVPLDIHEVEARTTDYRIIAEDKFFIKTAGAATEAASKATNMAGQAAGNVKSTATMAGGKVSNTFGKVFRQKKDEAQDTKTDKPETTCPLCGNSVPNEFKFCPSCGQSMATEKECDSCKEVIPLILVFVPIVVHHRHRNFSKVV
jgi:tellurite resistance protein